ncbi:MAG: BatA domain-containing protein [Myxococcales bacterium]|nr:BatA domain-containing protein [Myxococcales bacterium]
MTFAHPWMLLGALAAFIPLLIHLFDRRRPRPTPFPAIAFVLKSQKRTASRLRLKRLILYSLRTLFFLAVPIALARPEFVKTANAITAKGAAATVIVVDTSLAMRWSDGKPLFDLARKEAKAALGDLLTEEPAALVACTRAPVSTGPLSFEKARLIGQVDELKPGFEVVDVNRCLEVAARALDESPLSNRRIVLVTALTQNGLRLEAEPPVTTGPKGEKVKPEVVLRDVARGAEVLPNRAILDVRAEPAPQAGTRAWQFTFTVRNFSSEAQKDVELALKVEGQVVAKGFVDLAPEGTAQKALTYRFQNGGPTYVEGALTADQLPDDDVRGVVVTVPKELRALIVNGEPNPLKVKDEAYFTDAALSAPGSPVRAVVRDADAAWREDFSTWDVVMLLNVPPPPADVGARLADFVAKGGGLFISFGERTEVEATNAALSSVLPRKLRVVKTAVEPASADSSSRAARLAQLEAVHPVLAPFTGKAREGLTSTRFYRYVLFESVSNGDVTVLGALDDGAPALLATRQGKGRVLAFASSVDRDWSDFPIRTSFLPFMQRAAAWLTGTLDEREEVKVLVGASVTLELDAEHPAVVVKSPSGEERAVAKQADGVTGVAGPLPEPGRYAVLDALGAANDAASFAATIDPAASDVTRHSVEAVTAWFGEDVVRLAEGEQTEKKTPVWTWLLVVAALAFVAEGALLRK